MKIKYHGHSCFSVTSNNYVIVLDPYKGVNGFKDINLSANEVICSHSHFDHAYVDEIKITKKERSKKDLCLVKNNYSVLLFSFFRNGQNHSLPCF